MSDVVVFAFVEGGGEGNREYMAVSIAVSTDEEGRDLTQRFFIFEKRIARQDDDSPDFDDASRLAARFVVWCDREEDLDVAVVPYTSEYDWLVRCDWNDWEPMVTRG